MAPPDKPRPEDTPAKEPEPTEERPRRRDGPDGFQDPNAKKPVVALNVVRNDPGSAIPRSRVLDPRLVPLVPPTVTTDPARQFHALLGLPRQMKQPATPPPAAEEKPRPPPKAKPAPPPKPVLPPAPRPPPQAPEAIERILSTLPAARAQIIRQILLGPESRLKRALRAFLEDPKFQRLDFESQRRALAAFDLRY